VSGVFSSKNRRFFNKTAVLAWKTAEIRRIAGSFWGVWRFVIGMWIFMIGIVTFMIGISSFMIGISTFMIAITTFMIGIAPFMIADENPPLSHNKKRRE